MQKDWKETDIHIYAYQAPDGPTNQPTTDGHVRIHKEVTLQISKF